jgi:NitT/TauT family transport system ATP-binding protein
MTRQRNPETAFEACAPGGEAGAVVLSARGVSKSYSSRGAVTLVLDGVDLDVRAGSFVCVVGPSGAGKTTLLRCLSGLTAPTSGEIRLNGRPVDRPSADVAVVFQDYSRSLMPWMSVEGNVLLPLRGRALSKAERRRRAHAALEAVGLATSAKQYPWQLSGGMQQRAAIARALAYQAKVLLMDEPFASVDAQTRADLEDLVLGLRTEFGVTVLLVTHDIDEAVYLGDEVVVLSGKPTRVTARIHTPMGERRDQLTTKARPEFIALRTRVLQIIRGENGE